MENLSCDSSPEYFADGMTDELITNLASIASLFCATEIACLTHL